MAPLNRKEFNFLMKIAALIVLVVVTSWAVTLSQPQASPDTSTIAEVWMGVYMNGVKIGYSTSSECKDPRSA